MSVWLSLGVVLAVAAVVVVALPFLRRPGITAAEDRLGEPDELERRRLELAEERDRALAALKELEFDHRTGKVSDEDYRELVGPLRRRAAEALRASLGLPLPPNEREEYDREVAAVGSTLGAAFSTAWQEGRAMRLEEAMEQALEPSLSLHA